VKIIGIMSIGSFYSPWLPYTIASIYNVCDSIIISNVGYDMRNPNPNELVPLPKVTEIIKQLDIKHKIKELKNISISQLYTKFTLMTQKEANKSKSNNSWFDARGVGLTAANEQAVRDDADWILKIDTDQVLYKDIDNLHIFLKVFPSNGLKFRQYEFFGDIGGNDTYVSKRAPDSPYEDTVYVYKAFNGQYYGGGGSPALYLPGQDRVNTDVFHSAHLRSANPIWLTEQEKFDHFYGRAWFKKYNNEYGRFCPEVIEESKIEAYDTLQNNNRKLTDTKPPEVCYLKNPIDYIR